MDVEHVRQYFLDMTIAYPVSNWHRTYFDVYGDDGDHNKGEYFYNDDTEYNNYTFLLTSEVDQQVYISLYTYGDLQYVATCYESFYYSTVLITTQEHENYYQANPGAAHLPKIKLTKGDGIKVEVYTQFTNGDLLPHDWALVVLSEHESVEIFDCSNMHCKFKDDTDSVTFWILFAVGFIFIIVIMVCIIIRCRDPEGKDVEDNFQRTE